MTNLTTLGSFAANSQMTGDDRYEFILATAEQLFHERGYHAVSMRDLAGAVGIKMSSLYYYFESKEQILYEISRWTMETLIAFTEEALVGQKNTDAGQRLSIAIRVGVTFHIDYQAAAGVVLSESRKLNGRFRDELRRLTKTYENIFRSLVEEGIESGIFVRTDSGMATYIIMSALTRISIWHRSGGRLSTSDIVDHYSDLLIRMMMDHDLCE